MIETQKEKYRTIIQSASKHLALGDFDGREALYKKLRAANEALFAKKGASLTPEAMAALNKALEDVIAEDRQAIGLPFSSAAPAADSAQNPPIAGETEGSLRNSTDTPPKKSSGKGFFFGLVSGVALTAVVGGIAMATGYMPVGQSATGPATNSTLETLYKKDVAQIAVAGDYLEQIRNAIQSRQQKDATALTALFGGKFLPLAKVDRELARKMPKTLPKGTAIILRADATDHKILFNWPLCAAVQVAKPEMVDPKRAGNSLGCQNFGIWTAKAANW